jgi:hypothetical protein
MEHFKRICIAEVARINGSSASSPSTPSLGEWPMMHSLHVLCRPLFELSDLLPRFAAHYHRERLAAIRKGMYDRMAKLNEDANINDDDTNISLISSATAAPKAVAGVSCWPPVYDLLYFKLISIIFPVY